MSGKCCVPDCAAERKDFLLHRMPVSREKATVWLKVISAAVPSARSLKDLTWCVQSRLFVCHKHFESKYVRPSMRLTPNACPTLFSGQELNSGMTETTYADLDALEQKCFKNDDHSYSRKRHYDHSYAKDPAEISNTVSVELLEMCAEPGPSTKQLTSISELAVPTTMTGDNIVTPGPSQEAVEQTNQDILRQPSVQKTGRRKLIPTLETLSPSCRELYKYYLRAKKQLSYHRRAKMALKMSKEDSFKKLVIGMNPVAQRFLWMQIKSVTKNKRGRRFSLDEKIIALSIMKQSPKCYRFLQRIFILPCKTTLNKMLTELDIEAGISPQIVNIMKEEVRGWVESKKLCSIIFDEMKLDSGLHYSRKKDNIIGFVDLSNKTHRLADHALTFIVKGAVHKWQQPVAFYFSAGAASGAETKVIIKKVVAAVCETGLEPIALISDQGASFQTAFRNLQEETRRSQILAGVMTDDTINLNGHPLSVIYDPPHLIKGVRNNFLTKNILMNGNLCKWQDLVDVYQTDCSHARARLLPKLNDEHILPEKIKKMKVRNCVRVLSKTMAAALNYTASFYPSTDFRKYSVVMPKLQHARTKRKITSTKDTSGSHHPEVTLSVNIDGEDLKLELRLNEDLVPRGHTLSYQQDGLTRVHTPVKEDLDLCQYAGHVRGKPGSWVAVSTCHGVSGVIYDGQMRYIEPASHDINGEHFLYSHEHLTKNYHCGTRNSSYDSVMLHQRKNILPNRTTSSRHKRSSDDTLVREPYNVNGRSRYVELVLVVDHGEYVDSGSDLRNTHRQMKDLANILNSVYAPLNIFIALVGVEVWTEYDKIDLRKDSLVTLDNFIKYRHTELNERIPNDNAHLLTQTGFDNGVVGKAYIGVMCQDQKSAGVESNHSRVMGIVAMTVAHEMGHNFGMGHDEANCKCPDKSCIMGASSGHWVPVSWSSCSLQALTRSFEKELDYCLRNKPDRLFSSPTCGNGFLEEGEQCDCGTAPGSMDPGDTHNACTACCKPDCTLRANATCAQGLCCDVQTCRPKASATECRAANRECDLPEFCDGTSPFCPSDVHKMDTIPCGNGQAYCVKGFCRSHTGQCRRLWGITGNRSHDVCYITANVLGNKNGNCGYERETQSYRKCDPQDVMCGLLQCSHLGNAHDLEIANPANAVWIGASYPIDGNYIIPCRTVIFDMGQRDMDPGMVPDGAKCGPDKMCMQQKCLSVERVRAMTTRGHSVCPSDCSGHGVCNSIGNCHCDAGHGGPQCAIPGSGGSRDSGPASDTTSLWRFQMAMYIIFLGIIPAIALVTLLICFCPRCSKIRESYANRYIKPTKLRSPSFALPNMKSFRKWFPDSNTIIDRRRNRCTLNVKCDLKDNNHSDLIVKSDLRDKPVCENTLKSKLLGTHEQDDLVDHEYAERAQIVSSNVVNKLNYAQENKMKNNIVIVENHNAPIKNNVTKKKYVKPKIDAMKNNFETPRCESNTKDLNKKLAVTSNNNLGSSVNRPIQSNLSPNSNTSVGSKPSLSPKPKRLPSENRPIKPYLSPKTSVSPKTGVSPKPVRLPSESKPKPEIINVGLVSTTNEFLNQRSKLRKVGDLRDANK